MKSRTSSTFKKLYNSLPAEVQRVVWKNYLLWSKDPFHNSLNFKKILDNPPVWSARCGSDYRAAGVMHGDTVIWFFVGSHADYDRIIKLMRKR